MSRKRTPLAEGHVSTYVGPDARDRIDDLATRLGVTRAAWLRILVFAALRGEGAEVPR
jgi:hypothetical protein